MMRRLAGRRILGVMAVWLALCGAAVGAGAAALAQGGGGADPRHTGRSAFTGPQTAALKWKFRAGGRGQSFGTAVCDAAGNIYAVSGTQVYSLASDGSQRWCCDRVGNLGSLVLGGGQLYVVENETALCAISAGGELLWRYQLPARMAGAPLVDANGQVYAGCNSGQLIALTAGGALAWECAGGEFYFTAPLLGSDGLIYYLAADRQLLAVDATGQQRLRLSLPLDFVQGLSGDPAAGFVLYGDNQLAGLSRAGELQWTYAPRNNESGERGSLTLYGGLLVRNDGSTVCVDSDGKVLFVSPQGVELWRYQLADDTWGRPLALSDGAVAVLDNTGKLSVLNLDGSLRWEKALGEHPATGAAPAAGPGGMLYASSGGVLYAMHEDSQAAWNFSSSGGGGFAATPVQGPDGTVYAAGLDQMLYALNPAGELLWQQRYDGLGMFGPAMSAAGRLLIPAGQVLQALPVGASPAPAWQYNAGAELLCTPAQSKDGTVYTGGSSGQLLALHADGSLDWAFQSTGWIQGSSPAIGPDGRIYFGTATALNPPDLSSDDAQYLATHNDGTLFALNPDGGLAWSYKADNVIWSSPVLADDGTVYFATATGYFIQSDALGGAQNVPNHLYALAPDGTLRWSAELSGLVQGSAALGLKGEIYLCSWDRQMLGVPDAGHLFAFSPDGKLLWQGPYGCICTPCVGADGTIYSAGLDCKLYALTPQGQVRWSYQLGSLVAGSPVIGADGTLYVGSSDGYLYAFKDR